MIELARLKRLLALGLGLIGVAVGVAIVRQAADAIIRAATGADPTSIYHESPAPPSELLDVVEWLADPPRNGRSMEPATRRDITDSYARALAALDRAGRGESTAPLRTYLGAGALDAALAIAADPRSLETSTVHLRHVLSLDFYSDDGSVVAISAPEVEVARIFGSESADRSVVWSDEAWRFAMVLEDGNWRIHQLQIVTTHSPSVADSAELSDPVRGVNSVTVNGGDATWRSFDAAVAIDELGRVRDLGADTMRVFVAGPEFGSIDVGAISDFLDLAAANDVSVIPVLFDGSADHRVSGWRDDRTYLSEVVGGLAAHPAIVAWDLKNEPDLDDQRSGGPVIVDAWLERVASDVRRLDPVTPLTIGWSDARQATRVGDVVDVVSFHHFDDAASLEQRLVELRSSVGDRPIVVSEFGRPAWTGFGAGTQEAAQAQRVAELLAVIEDAELAGQVAWVLRDPDRPLEPGVVAGRASRTYGLLRSDGSERPVADVIRSGGTSPMAGPSTVEWARGNLFVLIVIAGAAAGSAVAVARRRRR